MGLRWGRRNAEHIRSECRMRKWSAENEHETKQGIIRLLSQPQRRKDRSMTCCISAFRHCLRNTRRGRLPWMDCLAMSDIAFMYSN